jgi:ribosomal protein S18 acetylase RimI-like enzyme
VAALREGLATRTDRLAVPRGTAHVDGGAWVAIHTPERPDFRYGNQLVIAPPAGADELAAALAVWRAQFAASQVPSVVLLWEVDVAGGAVAMPARDGLVPDDNAVLVLSASTAGGAAASPADPAAVALVDDDAGWHAIAALAAADDADPTGFWAWLYRGYRALVADGRAVFCAALEGDAAITAGGVVIGDGVARFQNIMTAAAHRNRGWATRLCRQLAARAVAAGARDVVVVAERDSQAERLYQRLGFRLTGYQRSLVGPRAAA